MLLTWWSYVVKSGTLREERLESDRMCMILSSRGVSMPECLRMWIVTSELPPLEPQRRGNSGG
jgi:hypothetical protein